MHPTHVMLMEKKVTIITGNYYPEDSAIGLYTTQFAEYLYHKNYEVSIITGFPYYPQWKIPADYIQKPKLYTETINGVRVLRYKQYVPEKVSFTGRIKMMFSFIKGANANAGKIKDADLVICIVPYTFSTWIAKKISKKTNAKLWIHIQDFEFDLALQSGILKNNILLKPLSAFIKYYEKHMLLSADTVSSISFSMLKKIKEKAPVKNTVYFPNWISSNKINPQFSKHHNYISRDKFTVLYSGNIGEKQDWHLFKELCYCINDDDIEIVIVGDGGYLRQLKQDVSSFPFIKFFPPVPYDELQDLLCSAQIHILFQKSDVVDSVMPSKILGMMASGKPSIITGSKESEVAGIITKSGGGYYFYDNKINEIYAAMKSIKDDELHAETLGKDARRFIIQQFSEEEILSSIEKSINSHL